MMPRHPRSHLSVAREEPDRRKTQVATTSERRQQNEEQVASLRRAILKGRTTDREVAWTLWARST